MMYRNSIVFFIMHPRPPISTLFPYTTLFRSVRRELGECELGLAVDQRKLAADVETVAGVERQRVDDVARRCVPRCDRSEEHTSELQSRRDLVCRLLLEKKKKTIGTNFLYYKT